MAKILKADSVNHVFEDVIQDLSYKLEKRPRLVVLIGDRCKSTEPDYVYLNQIQKRAKKYGVDLVALERSVLSSNLTLFRTAETAEKEENLDGAITLSDFSSLDRSPWSYYYDLDHNGTSIAYDILNSSPVDYQRFSCTANAVYQLLRHNDIPLTGKKIGVVGRSAKVGLPTALLLMQANATVTVYHSLSDLSGLKSEDIVISAVGKPKFLTADLFREGQTVVDVGLNTDPSTDRVCGDVDFDNVKKALGDEGAITPVPGGIGPLTNTILFSRLFSNAWKKQKERSGCL